MFPNSVRYAMSHRVAGYRRSLRHAILDQFIGQSSKSIYIQLKDPSLPVLFLRDLEQFCGPANVPISALPSIFSCYDVFTRRLSEEKFTIFLQDEVTCKGPQCRLSPELTEDQLKVLTEFAAAMKNRRTQAYWTKDGLSSERLLASSVWIALVRANPPGSGTKYVRLATLCRLADDLDLGIDIEDFISSLFLFFGAKTDRLDFTQFTQFMEAFG
jgi:hypothetical protein